MVGTLSGKPHAAALTLTALAMSLVSVACSTVTSSISAAPQASTVAGPTPTAIASPSLSLAAEDAGLRLVATLDKVQVEPGGTVTVGLALTNDRSTPVTFLEPCGPNPRPVRGRASGMTVQLPTPTEPAGETWTGRKGVFKDYALKESQGTPMESSIRNPPPTNAEAAPCHALAKDPTLAGVGGATLAPSNTYETDLTWTASLVRDLPSVPGSMPYSIVIQHDLKAADDGIVEAKTLEVGGMIEVLPGGPAPVSAGQALDAAIRDKLFATWLAKHPRKTWVNTNLFLQPGAIGVDSLPSVPYWDVELFAAPRSWVMLTVDASTAKILSHAVCNVPCSR
jgi:hypothetical protein